MTRILVAEDSPVNLALLTDLLEVHGHEVLTAGNGREALEAARSRKPDLILLDMMMPVMDGFEAAQRLKADPATRTIPIVALTALAMDGDERRALDAGCDAYVSKPIDTRALPVLLDRLLGPAAGGVPQEVLDAMGRELDEGLAALAAALDVLRRRGNDHGALREVGAWGHRLRGAAASLGLPDMAAELGAIEDAARRADAAGRAGEAELRAWQGRLARLHGMRAGLRDGPPAP